MVRSLFLFSLLLFATTCYAQNTRGDLAVHRETENDPAPLIRQLQPDSRDTNRVILLNKIARICWYQRTTKNNEVDSTLLFSRQAYALSKDLHFTEGLNEASFLICKSYLEKKDVASALKLSEQAYGEQKVRLLLIIAEPYVFHSQFDDRELLKALPLINRAKKVSIEIHSLEWQNECSNLLAKFYFNHGNLVEGKNTLLEVINNYDRLKDYDNEAKYWSRLGFYIPENNSTFSDIIHYREMAVRYYLLANNKKEAGYSLRDLAVIRTNHNQTIQAGKDLMEMLRLFTAAHEQLSTTTYYLLSEYYRFTGRYDEALAYGLQGLKSAGDNLDKKINPCIALAGVYAVLRDYKNGIKYYRIVLDYQENRNLPAMFVSCYKLANMEAASGNPKQALILLNKFLTAHPDISINNRELFASNYGYIYNLLGDHSMAEHYYRQMLSLDSQADQENGKNLGPHLTLTGGGAYYLMGKFYVERARYKEAKPLLLKSLQSPQYFDKDQEFDTYQLLFKTDSAMGNYLSAIKHLAHYKALSDSINSVASANKISALNIQYETAQKAKDIKLLENKQKLQEAVIQRSDSLRKLTFGGVAFLLFLVVFIFIGYRNKQRSNHLLQAQQAQINTQNTLLHSVLLEKDKFLIEKDNLLEEKDSLLKEKDWLIKEVHHRVKNNLQIIMSLLRTQLAHLKTEDAKDAIIDSENRVQAIALIHQKLYNTDNLASISMPAYVADLINYLSDGLATKDRNVKFHQAVEPTYIDLAQAVPLGLILNEAITNAIKYGSDGTGVCINIVFRRLEGSYAILSITDKGEGLPHDFDLSASKSLGMQMMKGLSRQLKGVFEINNNDGVTVTIKFQLLPVFSTGPNQIVAKKPAQKISFSG